MRVRLVLVAFIAVALCSSRSAARGTGAVPQVSDTVVKMAGAPRHAGGGVLRQELILGAGSSADEYLFSDINQVVMLRDGSIVVTDGVLTSAPSLRVYDASGKYVRTLGRRGQGPGEFMLINGVAALPDGRLIVRDPQNNRINVYAANGAVLDQWNFPRSPNVDLSPGLFADSAGTVYLRLILPAPAGQVGGVKPIALVRFGSDGRVIDTVRVPALPVPPNKITAAKVEPGGTSRNDFTVPFMPDSRWALSPRGHLITGTTGRYAFEILAPRVGTAGAASSSRAWWKAGDPIISVRRNVQPVALASEERTEWIATMEALARTVDPRWRWTGPEVPRSKPAYRDLKIAADGRIWVLVSTPSERIPRVEWDTTSSPMAKVHWREPARYDVFEPDGSYLGVVAIPPRTTFQAARGDVVWATVAGPDGEPTVQRFRVVWR
jgi:hypothetical protein